MDLPAGALDAPGEQSPDSQLGCDLPVALGGPAILERRRAGGDLESVQLSELGDDFGVHPQDERLIRGISADILEGKDGDAVRAGSPL